MTFPPSDLPKVDKEYHDNLEYCVRQLGTGLGFGRREVAWREVRYLHIQVHPMSARKVRSCGEAEVFRSYPLFRITEYAPADADCRPIAAALLARLSFDS